MANEELHQRGYLTSGELKGAKFGIFEELNIGGTTVQELKANNIDIVIPDTIAFPFVRYKAPKKPANCRPDRVFLKRTVESLYPVAVTEHKAPKKLRSAKAQIAAEEQALYAAAAVGARIASVSNGKEFRYIDV